MAGSEARYLPFGGWRGTTPTAGLTDRGYTGHKSNNLGTNDIGLIYMNARFYAPGVSRFVTADTIVPNPVSPQSYNRFSYTLNNPLLLIDSSGHDSCSSAFLVNYEVSHCKYWLLSSWDLQVLKNHSANYVATQNAYDRDIWLAVGWVMESLPEGFNTSFISEIGGEPGLARLVKRMIARESQFVNSETPNASVAYGLMQIKSEIITEMKDFGIIADGYGYHPINPIGHITNPQTNIYLGLSYLVRRALVYVGTQELSYGWESTSGEERWKFALAVYNAGPLSVEEARINCAAAGNCNPSLWNDVSSYLPQETQNYVADIMAPWERNPAISQLSQLGLQIVYQRGGILPQ